MIGSDPFTFTSYYSDEINSLMQPVVLKMTIVSRTHVHKTVVKNKSSADTFIKGKDKLPN